MSDLITTDDLTASCPTLSGRADLARLVSSASQAVEAYCGRTFAVATYTERHDGRGLSRVWLRQRPVIEVTSVSADGYALDNTSGDAWTLDPDTGELLWGNGFDDPRFAPRFARGSRNIEVVYSAGFDPIPEAVATAAILTAKWLADRTGASGAFQSERIGDYSYTLATQAGLLPDAAEVMLASYVQGGVW